MNQYSIGIDIGGTNTDAVLVDNKDHIISCEKIITTEAVENGFKKVIETILTKANVKPSQINNVYVGTTHATNALLQRLNLYKVGVIRITSECGDVVPPCYQWPEELKQALFVDCKTIDGGFECDGRVIKKLDRSQARQAIEELLVQGVESFAIVGVFSPINHEQEYEVKQLIDELSEKKIPVTISCQISGVGFIERENATILNATLKKSLQYGFASLQDKLNELGINAPLFLTQNNGTILSVEQALEFPVLTISAGPTNSFVGAAKLTGLSDAVIADIGGTSTDVGIIINKFARRSIKNAHIGGVRLNFSMPDVISIAMGGGSYVDLNNAIKIGPRSAGKNLFQEAVSFGGSRLTLTDIAIQSNKVQIPGSRLLGAIPSESSNAVFLHIQKELDGLKKKMAGPRNLPLVVVGGGALLIKEIASENIIIPEYGSVANAYGAALAEISGSIDTVVSLNNREQILQDLTAMAKDRAVQQGARRETLKLVNKEIIPYHYVSNNLARVKITVAGKK